MTSTNIDRHELGDHVLNDISDSTVVISLRHREDRHEHIRRQFAELGIRYRLFDAIRPQAHEILWTEMRGMEAYGQADNLRSDYVLGAVGCKRSAIAVLREFVDSSAATCLMIQDDCSWQPGSEGTIRRAWQELPQDWDMLYFSASNRRAPAAVSVHLTRLRAARHCTAILFRRDRASEILHGLERCSTELDVYMEQIHEAFNAYCVVPMPARQLVGHSDIVGSRIEQTPA